MATAIPEVLRICDRCGALASGTCEDCLRVRELNEQLEAAWHPRTAALYGGLPRVDATSWRPSSEPEWMCALRGWLSGVVGIAWSWLLLLAAAAAFWLAGEWAVRELLG